MNLFKIKNSNFYKKYQKKSLRYLRWIVKAGFLFIFVVPIYYLPGYQELSVSSLFFSKPSGQISGFTSVEYFFMVPIGQSPDIVWLSYYGDPNPGYWIVEPFGGLQALLSGQIGGDLLFSILVAILFFVVLIVLLGNVFCSWGCPVGSIIDSFDMFIGKFFLDFDAKREKRARQRIEKERKQEKTESIFGCGICPVHRLGGKVAGGVLVSSLVGSFVLKFPVFCVVCPIGVVSRGLFHFKAMMAITGTWMVYWLEMLFVPVGVTLLSLRERRFFCKRICPVGAFLGGVGAFNPFIKPRIKDEKCIMKGCPEDCEENRFDGCYACRILDDHKCEKVCPVDIDLGNHGSLARCTKCMECYIVCPYDAIEVCYSGKPEGVKLVLGVIGRIKNRLG